MGRYWKEKNDLGLDINVTGKSDGVNQRVATASDLEEHKVYGREKVKEDLVESLMSDGPSNSPYSVIPIVGMGGIGKTTLAQLIYNDERMNFDYKAWVYVSDDFKIPRIIKTILQHWGSCEANDLSVLQKQFKEKLQGKKFLIVLDDVWCIKYEVWKRLCASFAVGALGSKIVVTTRQGDVSSMTGSVSGYKLKELSYDDSLCLFSQHALGSENFDAHPNLKAVGANIVHRCKGLPLAAKILGGLLRHKQDLKDWEGILNSEIWDFPEDEILSALRLSYYHLPSHLKPCFAFCAIFPKSYEFDKKELILLWMAEGFLQQEVRTKQMEDLGHECFRDLLSRSFFQQSTSNKSRYVMHDLLLDLARFVSGEICFNLDGKFKLVDTAESFAKVRHLSFTSQKYDIWRRFVDLLKMKSLRTFLALQTSLQPAYSYLSSKVLHDLLPKLKCLKVLSLRGYSLEELPDSIGALKHLRYLDLSHTLIQKLPESLGELLNLQTLRLDSCYRLAQLPTNICNLINLRHLHISDTTSLEEMPLQINKLKNLRTLPKFVVREGAGCSIAKLKELSELQGLLHITGLHNVVNIQDAKLANLKDKQGLAELSLEWIDKFGSFRNKRNEQEVLHSLRPHQSLAKLSITSYCGSVFPSWLGDPSFTKLECLELINCPEITSLSSLERITTLRHLRIKGMGGVSMLDFGDFPLLETLIIEDMMGLEQWSEFDGLNEEVGGKFPKLIEFSLINCPKLTGKFPSCFASLKAFRIMDCPLLTHFPKVLQALHELHVRGCQEVILRSVPNLPSLVTLNIERISGFVCLSEALVQALSGLKFLTIEECKDLKYLWQDGTNIDRLANLMHLKVFDCLQLESLVEREEGLLPCNLRVLEIKQCDNLKKLPNGLHSLTSLGDLDIRGCKKLVSLPEGPSLPHNLEQLYIEGCDSLKSFPRGKLPTTLKFLYFSECENLESLPEDRMEISHSHQLQQLTLIHLVSVSQFPAYEFCSSLKTLLLAKLKIQSFPSLQSLFHLNELIIAYCPELEWLSPLPNLTVFSIGYCEKLRSLPSNINNLTSLQTLFVNSCCLLESFSEGGFPPNLVELTILNCPNVAQPIREWGLCTLTSLKKLTFDSKSACTTNLDYFPDDDGSLLPTSLTSLYISSHKNLKSISSGIKHLTSLEELEFYLCPRLRVLPKEGFPATLGHLLFKYCPLLEERCLKDDGDYWPIIANIPCVEIVRLNRSSNAT